LDDPAEKVRVALLPPGIFVIFAETVGLLGRLFTLLAVVLLNFSVESYPEAVPMAFTEA
jgi:hypothetical protein